LSHGLIVIIEASEDIVVIWRAAIEAKSVTEQRYVFGVLLRVQLLHLIEQGQLTNSLLVEVADSIGEPLVGEAPLVEDLGSGSGDRRHGLTYRLLADSEALIDDLQLLLVILSSLVD
jgi:hypothetical protein